MSVENFYSPDNGILTQMPMDKRYKLIGEVVTLMLGSEMHRGYLINDIGAVFFPPMHLNQFRIYRKGDRPIGMITWAWLSEEVEKQYVTGKYNLKPKDWNGGDRGWVIDFMAPFGHTKQIVHDLKHNIFPDKVGKAIRMTPDGKIKGIWKLHGANCMKEAKDMSLEGLVLPE